MTKTVPISKGYSVMVDDDDFARVAARRWYIWGEKAGRPRASGYVRVNGRNRTLILARFILNAPDGLVVDHINGDALDNRRCNLRLCTQAQNLCNRRPRPGTFKGVRKRCKRWCAYIGVGRRRYHLGTFDTPEHAARVYDTAARKLHGEFARLNFPDTAEAA